MYVVKKVVMYVVKKVALKENKSGGGLQSK